MSDGNFNRALLPQTPYASGIKMGRQQMKAKAAEAFKDLLAERLSGLNAEEQADLLKDFLSRF
ncbi:hypothetical protein MR532_05400 [bacterium]|nr:hypothetical protein [bacterium]